MRRNYKAATVNMTAVIDAIAAEAEKILANINDPRADEKKERRITLQIHFKPNPESGIIGITSDINSTLAPKRIQEMAEICQQMQFELDDDESDEDQTYA